MASIVPRPVRLAVQLDVDVDPELFPSLDLSALVQAVSAPFVTHPAVLSCDVAAELHGGLVYDATAEEPTPEEPTP